MNRMKLNENVKQIKYDSVGKISMDPVFITSTKSNTKCFNFPKLFQNYCQILKAHLINDNQVLLILFCGSEIWIFLIDQRGSVLKHATVKQCVNNDCLLKSVMDYGNILLLIKHKHQSSAVDTFYIYMLDTNLVRTKSKPISNVSNIISLAANDSKYYCLLKSTSNVNFLSIYDNNFNEIATKGLEAKQNKDPFYFPSDTVQLEVSNKSIFILGNGSMKIMNEETGIITREFSVVGTSFDIIKNHLALFDGNFTISIYHQSGNIRKKFQFPELNECSFKFFSEPSMIGLNKKTGKIITSSLF